MRRVPEASLARVRVTVAPRAVTAAAGAPMAGG
jgi:hypothetical protein